MTGQSQDSDDFFIGIMVQKDGKWTPHSKFDDGVFGTALMKAEELDKTNEYDGVKVMRLSKSNAVEPKELWFSSRLKDRAEAQKAAELTAGRKSSVEKLRGSPKK